MVNKRLKVAFVIQRYGLDVAGGGELHARWLAEHMSKYWDIEVITTKAKDHVTWKNEYGSDMDIVNGVKVRRFNVDKERDIENFNDISNKVFKNKGSNIKLEEEWIKIQGPESRGLFEYLESSKDDYDLYIFFQYLFSTTYFGLPKVAKKALLVPTAHDEPAMYLGMFKKLFCIPSVIIPSTVEEVRLIRRVTNNDFVPMKIVGIGINVPDVKSIEDNIIKFKFNIDKPYLLYIGRIEEGKGCVELIDFFNKYKKETGKEIILVLAGKAYFDIPKSLDIKYLGIVSEEEKFALIKNCMFLANPSMYESLSMTIMEAWFIKKPVLVNGRCEVLKGQCKRSNGGLWYENIEEFIEMVDWLMSHDSKVREMGRNGFKYVKYNYSWDVIETKLLNIVDKIENGKKN